MDHPSELDPVATLQRIALLLERAGEPGYRSRAFRRAARALDAISPDELRERAQAVTLAALPGVGPVTVGIAAEVLAGEMPPYLTRLKGGVHEAEGAEAGLLFAALRGNCHVHSEWSDGTTPMRDMALSAIELGHEYIVLTDPSPTLRIARGLSPERLREQIEVVARLNEELASFRILTGIECDILADQEDALLARLDIVVGSLHSLLRMEREAMTERMLTAIANPHFDILGHCTGRMKTRKRDRAESEFDSARVFEACASSERRWR